MIVWGSGKAKYVGYVTSIGTNPNTGLARLNISGGDGLGGYAEPFFGTSPTYRYIYKNDEAEKSIDVIGNSDNTFTFEKNGIIYFVMVKKSKTSMHWINKDYLLSTSQQLKK